MQNVFEYFSNFIVWIILTFCIVILNFDIYIFNL